MSKEAWQEKQVIIDEIKEKLEKAQAAVVIDYMGITVAQADAMRKKLREADVDYTVYKNTLVKRAIEGTQYESLGEVLAGPSAFAISYDDATAPARVINEVIEEYKKMEFKAGVIEGEFFDAEGIKQIAKIPSRDNLIAKFMGSIQSPITNFARVLNQIAEQGGADGAAAAAEPAEA
ncbi:50S ribosomal protein L10 [bacterium 210820-DFI.6.37]|nr:50S ribosomal protein L10 [bacterium 210820-DFI.6.37]